MRLFTAIELTDAVREELRKLRRQICSTAPQLDDAVSWVKPENLHVTLKFLGEVPDDKVMDLCRVLGGIELAQPVTLRVDGVGFFPPGGPVRVVVARLGGDTEVLQRLFSDVERALHDIGFPLEHRAFTPHVTLGRARRHARVARSTQQTIHRGEAFEAASFTLFQSRLTRTGAEYQRVARFPPA